MARQNMKLVLRAFHGECDAVLAKVVWNNITKMEERLRKSFEAINQLSTVLQVSVTQEYLQLKIDELRLAYEYEEKRHEEQEQQRRIREQMREEERAQQALEKARIEAEREELRFQRALEKARIEASRVTGEQLRQMEERIHGLELKLAEAHQQKERAISMAQLTKSGYVYVISNVGSFGENVYKVGMTRRLEPMERVYELGDASVPFPFDVHAMIYSDNAPALETMLHGYLSHKRLNMVNPRKEFFHVNLEDLEAFVKGKGLKIEFTKLAEAKEYRKTVAFRQEQEAKSLPEPDQFPSDLFATTTG